MAWPDAFRIDELLESLPRSSVPPEVEAALLSLGFPPLKAVRKHKAGPFEASNRPFSVAFELGRA